MYTYMYTYMYTHWCEYRMYTVGSNITTINDSNISIVLLMAWLNRNSSFISKYSNRTKGASKNFFFSRLPIGWNYESLMVISLFCSYSCLGFSCTAFHWHVKDKSLYLLLSRGRKQCHGWQKFPMYLQSPSHPLTNMSHMRNCRSLSQVQSFSFPFQTGVLEGKPRKDSLP